MPDSPQIQPYFGFFFLKDLEGETLFGFLTGFTGPFFITDFFFVGTGFLLGIFVLLGGLFVTFAGVFLALPTDFIGFFGVFAVGFTSTGFFAGFFTGFAGFAGNFEGGAGLDFGSAGFAAGVTFLEDPDTPGLPAISCSCLGIGITVGLVGCAEAGDSAVGGVQLRLTASGSILLNCDSNSGSSGTSK
jgi:hypothetical protein